MAAPMGSHRADPFPRLYAEFQMVKLKRSLSHKGVVYPANTSGTIVEIHHDGEGFEVEFSDPVPAVIGLYPNQIEAA